MSDGVANLRQRGTASGHFEVAIPLGMQHLGRAGLCEAALFREAGHARWTHIENITGVPTSCIQDGEGRRLYATFYYVDLALPGNATLSQFGENGCVTLSGSLARFGTQLDGTYLFGAPRGGRLRMSNVFINQEWGPAKLTVTSPVNVDLAAFDQLDAAPETREICRRARDAQTFLAAPGTPRVPLVSTQSTIAYTLDPDRDLNGAGLLYFANFVHFFERGERAFLDGMRQPTPGPIVDGRSTNRRQVGYFANATAKEQLEISTRAFVERAGEDGDVVFVFDTTIFRQSDHRLLALSTARKIAPISTDAEREWRGRLY